MDRVNTHPLNCPTEMWPFGRITMKDGCFSIHNLMFNSFGIYEGSNSLDFMEKFHPKEKTKGTDYWSWSRKSKISFFKASSSFVCSIPWSYTFIGISSTAGRIVLGTDWPAHRILGLLQGCWCRIQAYGFFQTKLLGRIGQRHLEATAHALKLLPAMFSQMGYRLPFRRSNGLTRSCGFGHRYTTIHYCRRCCGLLAYWGLMFLYNRKCKPLKSKTRCWHAVAVRLTP